MSLFRVWETVHWTCETWTQLASRSNVSLLIYHLYLSSLSIIFFPSLFLSLSAYYRPLPLHYSFLSLDVYVNSQHYLTMMSKHQMHFVSPSLKASCWSPKGNILVFSVEGDPSLYYIKFPSDDSTCELSLFLYV